MVLGALVSAGLSWTELVRGLKGLKLTGYQLRQQDVHRGALHATKVHVIIRQGFHRPLSISRIRRILSTSTLPDLVKQQSMAVFDRLADAEGLAHPGHGPAEPAVAHDPERPPRQLSGRVVQQASPPMATPRMCTAMKAG